MTPLTYTRAWLVAHGYSPDFAGTDAHAPAWLAVVRANRAARHARPPQPAASVATTPRTTPRGIACVHRGAEAGSRVCPTCAGGSVRIKVFQCGFHGGECSVDRAVGVRVCSQCADFAAPPVVLAASIEATS